MADGKRLVAVAYLARGKRAMSRPAERKRQRVESLFDTLPSNDEQGIRQVLSKTLKEVREILHRSGRLSSRHEALDEIAKLLFAHVMSIDTGGSGICREALNSHSNAAIALKTFISEAFRLHLPNSLAHEIQPDD